ncbi:hypothetical protein INR49_014272 [Caranx melampygus]|nr:hypothetical protein INR49_014272 [Caranx melampygus]
MLPVDGNSGWMFAVRTVILFSGVFLKITSGIPGICPKKILVVSTEGCNVDVGSEFLRFHETEVCFWAVNTTNTNTNTQDKQDSLSLVNLSKWLQPDEDEDDRQVIPLTKPCVKGSYYDRKACEGIPERKYKLTLDIMDSLSSVLGQLGTESIATVAAGNVTGTLVKLDPKDSEDINCGIKTSGSMNIVDNVTDLVLSFPRSVHIPKEASDKALERNGSFAGVLLFPDMYQDDANSFFINNEILGIEMGAQISNLSHKINIQYNDVDKKGMIASCRSWDGKGRSPPPGNISSVDFKSLTYITSIGCGLSMFFLAVAVFMHCLIRKQRASQSTQLLMHLFVAMFSLNLFFLINETIANLGNYDACVVMAAAMHYAMLATFTWFFIEALNLYFNLWLVPAQVNHYMMKLCITGWVTPAVVVVALLASRQYDYMAIYTDDGNSAKMCWIPDAIIHQGVNIGYYAVVFLFTFIIFIITVRQIVQLKSTADKVAATAKRQSSIKTNSFSIFGLLLLLGITWAFAFFSHGPLLLASYYIFTILNSFQGFFLFIYYYNSSKTAAGDKSASANGSSTATPDTVLSSPYQ